MTRMIGRRGFKDHQLIAQHLQERSRPPGGWSFWARRELVKALKPISSVNTYAPAIFLRETCSGPPRVALTVFKPRR
jgi:hypothetical protein